MSKRYLHSNNGSRLVEDGSEEMTKLLDSGEWHKLKTEVKSPVTGEAPEDIEEPPRLVSDIDDDELVELYDEVDKEMVKRGLLEADDAIVVPIEARSDDELKEIAKEYKIPSFASMKRETLLIKIKEIENA